jgi:5-methyltetrahydrofolate--homocysteine methyltransferase
MPNPHIRSDNTVPTPPFWGTKCIENIPLSAVVPYINKISLYKVQWGFKPQGKRSEEYFTWARENVDPILMRLIQENTKNKIMNIQAIYGYFPCIAEKEDLIILDIADRKTEIARFTFPRQQDKRQLCISDFYRTDEVDVVAFQIATVGQHASDYARELFQQNHYQDYLFWHGLNVETAEGLAEFVHKRIRAEWGFAAEDAREMKEVFRQSYRGSRYSFGYPACPRLEDQAMVLDLLDCKRIGVTLSDEYQLWPEETTSAIVVHHPDAKYFTM